MKKRDLLCRVRRLARQHDTEAILVRHGKHEIWECDGFTFPIPRHNEIAERTATAILDRLQQHLESR